MHEDEALVVRLVFEFYTSPQYRYESKRIARHLNMAGYQRRTAGPFVHVAVMHIVLIRAAPLIALERLTEIPYVLPFSCALDYREASCRMTMTETRGSPFTLVACVTWP